MSFTFNELDLSGSKINTGGQFLKEGRHLVKIKEAIWQKSSKGGVFVEVKFEATNGSGTTTGYYNIKVPSSTKSEQIGKDQFKSLLYWAGHPNPSHPGDINSLKGLVVGVYVEGEVSDAGTDKERTYHKVKASFDPFEIDGVNFVKKAPPVATPTAANPLLSATGQVINF